MLKQKIKVLVCILTMALILPLVQAPFIQTLADTDNVDIGNIDIDNEIRGVWVATVFSIDFPKTKTIDSQKAELIKIVDTTVEAGLNTIFFQVRPQGDALYKSSIFPWAESLTGVQGKDPGFDPLEYIIQEGKRKGVAIHAWINPYRITLGTSNSPQYDITKLALNHPVRKNPQIAVAFDDGRLYLNPGEPAAKQLVLDGVKEIIDNYDVAGIHFDDYFYPSQSVTKNQKSYTAIFDDSVAYAKYGSGKSLADWRRDNTYDLIKKTHELVESSGKNILFGIAPSGIWDNKSKNPLGSDTNGFSSYSAIFADSRKWVKDEIIDYIAPQLYWQIGKKGSDYEILANWWSDVCKNTKVDLYIGQAAYRVDAWGDEYEIIRQIELNRNIKNIKGSIFYGYEEIAKNTQNIKDTLSNYFVNNDTSSNEILLDMPKLTTLIIASPSNGVTTTDDKSYIVGSGIKNIPIYLNGKEIERTESGHFVLFVNLNIGKNVFNFEHNGVLTEYVINRKLSSSSVSSSNSSVKYKDYKNNNFVATIKQNNTIMRTSNSDSASRKTPIIAGTTDYIVRESPSYYLLRYGGWTLKSNVVTTKKSLPKNVITQVLGNSTNVTTVKWKMPVSPAYNISENKTGFEITFYNTTGKKAFKMASKNPIFSSIELKQMKNNAIYTFTTKKPDYLFGYSVSYKNGYFIIEFKHPPAISTGFLPLKGKIIYLDSGHGGATNRGATGPMGSLGPQEAELNMAVMLQLEQELKSLGATTVVTSRDVTKDASQTVRENSVRNTKADISISIHHNSVCTNLNIGTISGTETYYTENFSERLAQTIQKNLINQTGAKDRCSKKFSLFMCRFSQMPSVLIELGFVTNPYEYENLVNTEYIKKEVDGITQGIIEYFRY